MPILIPSDDDLPRALQKYAPRLQIDLGSATSDDDLQAAEDCSQALSEVHEQLATHVRAIVLGLKLSRKETSLVQGGIRRRVYNIPWRTQFWRDMTEAYDQEGKAQRCKGSCEAASRARRCTLCSRLSKPP